MVHEPYAFCIRAGLEYARACEHCASACLGEVDVTMTTECIRFDRDYADLCLLAAQLMSRGSRFAVEACRLCAIACDACGAKCAKHKHDR